MKPVNQCKLLDKYRDGELNPSARSDFELHLRSCGDCRMTMSLLNNIVKAIQAEEVRPVDMADRIARQAFERAHSWDFEIISWLRPGPALAALMFVAVLFSSLWMVTGSRQGIAYSEYEKLIEETDSASLGTNLSQIQSGEFGSWLEEEGNSE